jgi:hypothetical protein
MSLILEAVNSFTKQISGLQTSESPIPALGPGGTPPPFPSKGGQTKNIYT